jgi:hypothetical protein
MMTERINEMLLAGRVIEAGWLALLQTMPPETRENEAQLRTAFYAGAHYLFTNLARAAHGENATTMAMLDREFAEYLDARLYYMPAEGTA